MFWTLVLISNLLANDAQAAVLRRAPLCDLYLEIGTPLKNRTPHSESPIPALSGDYSKIPSAEAYMDLTSGIGNFEPTQSRDEAESVSHSPHAFHHLVLFRDGAHLPKGLKISSPYVLEGSFPYYLSIQNLRALKNRFLDRLYNRYSQQGPERADEIQNYRPEDVEYSNRTVNLMWLQENPHSGKWSESWLSKSVLPISHFQIQTSSRPQDRLNTERHIREDFNRGPGERWGDFGRLFFERNANLPPQATTLLQDRAGGRQTLVLHMLRTATSWFLHSYKGEFGVFQVNNGMLALLRSLLPKGSLSTPREIRVGNHAEPEWVVVLRRSQLQEIERRLLIKEFLTFLDRLLIYPEKSPEPIRFRFGVFLSGRPFERKPLANALGHLYIQSLAPKDRTYVNLESPEFIIYDVEHLQRLRAGAQALLEVAQ